VREKPSVKEILKDFDVKPPFIHKGFHAKFYPIDFVQRIWNKWGDYSGYYYKLHISAFHDNYWDLYYYPSEFTRMQGHYLSVLDKNKKFLDRHYSDWKNSCVDVRKSMRNLQEEIDGGDFSRIKKAYLKFVELYLYEYALSAPVQEAFGFRPEEWIIPEVKSYSGKYKLDFDEIFPVLTSPVNLSFVTEEERDLLKIVISAKEKKKKYDLKKHSKKYYWLRNNYSTIERLSIGFFEKRASGLAKKNLGELRKELLAIEKQVGNIKSKKKDLFKKHKPSGRLVLFTKIFELFAEMQDVRKAIVLEANYFHLMFLKQVEKEYSVKPGELWYYTFDELISAIENKNFHDKR